MTMRSQTEEAAWQFIKSAPSLRQRDPLLSNNKDSAPSIDDLDEEACGLLSEECGADMATALLGDLLSPSCAWRGTRRVHAIKLLKELSRSKGASRAVSSSEGIGNLVELIVRSRRDDGTEDDGAKGTPRTARPDDEDSESSMEQQDLALRILNNVLVQHDDARQTFVSNPRSLSEIVRTLKCAQTSMLVFLTARLIFFGSLFESQALKDAVEEDEVVIILSQHLTYALQQPQSPQQDMAIGEILKTAFNISIFYPRSVRKISQTSNSHLNEILVPLLPPTVAVLTQRRTPKRYPLVPPIINAIALLLNFPIEPNRALWEAAPENRSPNRDTSIEQTPSAPSAAERAKRIAATLFRHSGKGKQRNASENEGPDVVIAVLHLLDASCTFLFGNSDTSHVDSKEANRRASSEDIEIEDTLEPAVLVLRKLADEVDDYRALIKNRLLPADIDRKRGIDERDDLTGILVRLMSSLDYPRLARACGEALLAICGGQASQLASEVGYGPCAGFLVNSGQGLSLPTPSQGTEKDGEALSALNPITGKAFPTQEEVARQDEETGFASLTQEEKEAEAEHLFSLFDRLDKTGIVKVRGDQHPMRQAVDSGRIQELEVADEQAALDKLKIEEAEDEEAVQREMTNYRARGR